MAGVLHWLLVHPIVLGLVLAGAALVTFRTVAGRVGALAGVVSAFALLDGVFDNRRIVLAVGWVLRRSQPVAWLAAGLLIVAAGLVVLARTTRLWVEEAGAAVIGFVAMALLVTLLTFGVAWGSRYGSVVNVGTSIPAVTLGGGYVAMGDSYSAGEGLAPYLPGTDTPPAGNDCHRSDRAYPELLRLRPAVAPVFVACSGARSGQLFGHAQRTAPPPAPVQAAGGVLGPGVRLVTLTIGGNDVRFTGILRHCFLNRDCLDVPFEPGPPGDDEAADPLPPAAPLRDWARAALPVVERRLTAVFSAIRTQAPNARIIALGYPRLFPVGKRTLQFNDCDSILRQVDIGERDGLDALQRDFNATIAAAARSAGIDFIDPSAAFDLHEACGVLGGMINAAKLTHGTADRGAFHPTATGQKVLARLVACRLRSGC
jgi:hypothetical protein